MIDGKPQITDSSGGIIYLPKLIMKIIGLHDAERILCPRNNFDIAQL
jgi:hypothetical protein